MSTTTLPRTIVFFGVTENTRGIADVLPSFIDVGFNRIALVGQSSQLDALTDTIDRGVSQRSDLPKLEILVFEVDINAVESIGLASHNIRSKLGAWDVFVNCLSLSNGDRPKTTIRGADEDDWWEPFERNVRTLHSIARHFFPKKTANAVFVNLVTVDIDSVGGDKNSAENTSQLAAARVVTLLGKENAADGFRAVNVHLDEGPILFYQKLAFLVDASNAMIKESSNSGRD